MGDILNRIRNSLIKEASKSPNLLSDLAGLEKYIAESYSSRSFIELLQNADDAGANRMLVKRVKQHIIVANDGRKFTVQDFESLCRSAASKKERRTSIGFRGIGFKSVVGFAKRIHLISGDLEVTFCRELTSKIIPEAQSVPLIRIPHSIDPEIRTELSHDVKNVFLEGYNTVFVFSHLIANFVESEFESLDPTSLLFLRNVQKIILKSASPITFSARRINKNTNSFNVELAHNTDAEEWTVFCHEDICIALKKKENKYITLPEKEAVVHAFLPTTEHTGFGFKVNGDISTDPSRLRVILDENTLNTIHNIAFLFLMLLKESFEPNNKLGDESLIECLIPTLDPRMINLQKSSFQKQFITVLKQAAEGVFDNFYRRPNWLNPLDSQILAEQSRIRLPSRNLGEVKGLDSLLRFFGVQEISLDMISDSLKKKHISTQGASEVVSHITKQSFIKQITLQEINPDWKIWYAGNAIHSLREIVKDKKRLDTEFVDMVTERVGISSGLRRLLALLTDTQTAEKLIPPPKPAKNAEIKPNIKNESIPSKSISLTKWRSAEQQVLEILNSDGWTAKDVSRQNIGYDIEAINPKGEKICVEVKSLKYEGQDFTLTSNEEATAREKGEKYILALVVQKKEQLSVMFINNPLNVIKLERQCRQWVWLCSSYEFNPRFFEFNG